MGGCASKADQADPPPSPPHEENQPLKPQAEDIKLINKEAEAPDSGGSKPDPSAATHADDAGNKDSAVSLNDAEAPEVVKIEADKASNRPSSASKTVPTAAGDKTSFQSPLAITATYPSSSSPAVKLCHHFASHTRISLELPEGWTPQDDGEATGDQQDRQDRFVRLSTSLDSSSTTAMVLPGFSNRSFSPSISLRHQQLPGRQAAGESGNNNNNKSIIRDWAEAQLDSMSRQEQFRLIRPLASIRVDGQLCYETQFLCFDVDAQRLVWTAQLVSPLVRLGDADDNDRVIMVTAVSDQEQDAALFHSTFLTFRWLCAFRAVFDFYSPDAQSAPASSPPGDTTAAALPSPPSSSSLSPSALVNFFSPIMRLSIMMPADWTTDVYDKSRLRLLSPAAADVRFQHYHSTLSITKVRPEANSREWFHHFVLESGEELAQTHPDFHLRKEEHFTLSSGELGFSRHFEWRESSTEMEAKHTIDHPAAADTRDANVYSVGLPLEADQPPLCQVQAFILGGLNTPKPTLYVMNGATLKPLADKILPIFDTIVSSARVFSSAVPLSSATNMMGHSSTPIHSRGMTAAARPLTVKATQVKSLAKVVTAFKSHAMSKPQLDT